jgi:DNA-binding transcriptional LysR family regulator
VQPDQVGAHRAEQREVEEGAGEPPSRRDLAEALARKGEGRDRGTGCELCHDLERGDLDAALIKREAGEKGGIAVWPEHLRWVTGTRYPLDLRAGRPLPLAVFQQGCLYRNRAIHMLERAERTWHVAYTSPNLVSIQAAVSAGLGVSILPELAVLPDHRLLGPEEGFPPVPDTEVALVTAPGAGTATRNLADLLLEFYATARPSVFAGGVARLPGIG